MCLSLIIGRKEEHLRISDKCDKPEVDWVEVILPDGQEGIIPYCNNCEIFTSHGLEYNKGGRDD